MFKTNTFITIITVTKIQTTKTMKQFQHLDQDVNEVEEVDEDRVVELPQLLLPVDILGGVEPLDALGAHEETHHLTHR